MTIRTTEELGTAVRAQRKALRITQSELAMTCGTGVRFIVDLERGKPTCHIGKALAVLRSLGLILETDPIGRGTNKK